MTAGDEAVGAHRAALQQRRKPDEQTWSGS